MDSRLVDFPLRSEVLRLLLAERLGCVFTPAAVLLGDSDFVSVAVTEDDTGVVPIVDLLDLVLLDTGVVLLGFVGRDFAMPGGVLLLTVVCVIPSPTSVS